MLKKIGCHIVFHAEKSRNYFIKFQ